MTLIDGDRIITAQLYDDQHEEFTDKKMSIIDYINAYTDEGVTEADVVDCTKWIPVSERLPEEYKRVIVSDIIGIYIGEFIGAEENWGEKHFIFINEHGMRSKSAKAWMELPEPYNAESEEV